MSIDTKEFRDALGRFATGVTVITTANGAGELFGLTANSFTSLSLDPPLVLFCLDRKAMSFDAFKSAGHFAVNVLSEDQQELSSHFARSVTDKWNGVAHDTLDSGCPVLPGCIATMECETHEIHKGGDHVIIVGRVIDIRSGHDHSRPLLFYQGRYNALSV